MHGLLLLLSPKTSQLQVVTIADVVVVTDIIVVVIHVVGVFTQSILLFMDASKWFDRLICDLLNSSLSTLEFILLLLLLLLVVVLVFGCINDVTFSAQRNTCINNIRVRHNSRQLAPA
ncbi:unnamed protein product [Schistosoma mattheei]|uniref:Uncharacterized protein n=1 Tax=Schistosoma mattheei TaxID=31246 RepID=A0A3P8CD06_9TREM|nr:unnamed protein product [Schistosoma mattheei]